MLCKQTCATMGVCTCGQWEAKADPITKLEERIRDKAKPKVVVSSTPVIPGNEFEKLIGEQRG